MASPMTVTAVQGGGTFEGMILRVVVLLGTAAVQNGATAASSSGCSASITTTVTRSRVYGGLCAQEALTAEPSCTLIDSYADATNGNSYGTFRAAAATGTPGSVLVGSSTGVTFPDVAAAEILPGGNIIEDASAPPLVTTETATTLTTASFTPPDGALILALIGSDGAANGVSGTSMSLSGGGLTWTPLAEATSASTLYAGVWIAQLAAPPLGGLDDPVITVTQTGSAFNGLAVRVYAVTGARPAALQSGATATQSGAAAHEASITTTVTGSQVYGALNNSLNASFAPSAATTLADNIADSVNQVQYGTCKATAVTGTPGAVTIGDTATSAAGSCSLLEILPAPGQSLAVSGLSPAVASTFVATAVATANFSAPNGSLLVVIVSADGDTGVNTVTVTGGGLAFAEKVKSNAAASQYTGIWIADVPAAGGNLPQIPNYLIAELAAGMALRLEEDRAPGGAAAAAGSLGITGTAAAAAPASAAGTLGITAAAAAQAPAAAAGALTLTAAAAAQSPAAAAGSIALAGTAAAAAPAAASGALAIAGTAAAAAAVTAAGSIVLAGTATAAGPAAAAAGSLAIAGTAAAKAAAAASGALALSGTAAAAAAAAAAGSLVIAGTATAAAPVTAAGSLVLSGTAAATGPGTAAAGALALTGAAAAQAPAAAAGLLAIAGTAAARAPAAAAGSITLTGTATGPAPPVATGTARQGVAVIPAALAGQSAAARAQSGTAALPAARAQDGQMTTAQAQSGQMPVPHAQGGQ